VSEAESIIGSLAPWYGAKRTMAPEIVRALGPHHSYWEPFCGSMAVLLGKPPSRTEVVNDLHGDLVNLARVIQSPTLGPKLYRSLRRVLASEALFRDALLSVCADGPPPPDGRLDWHRAHQYFVASWQGMNGVAGTSAFNTNFARRFSSLGGDGGARFVGAVRSIPAWRRRLERVQVLSSDGIGLCEKIEDREGTVIYADPPYLVKGAAYLHDFAADDHGRLAEVLNRFRRTRVVVSYYTHPRLADLYPAWHTRRIDVAKSLVNPGRRGRAGATKAPEVLLSNLPFPETRAVGLFAEIEEGASES
jgi:DNA adenine methylase